MARTGMSIYEWDRRRREAGMRAWIIFEGPPPGSEVLRLVVRDPEGLTCENFKYVKAALLGRDCSVWAIQEDLGARRLKGLFWEAWESSYQLTDRGRDTKVARLLRAFYRPGDELVLAAYGPDARRTLEGVRVLLEAPAEERRAVYRGVRTADTLRRALSRSGLWD